MHFLKFRRDQRIWQDVSVEEIVSDVFNAHPQAQGRFQFALSGQLPTRSYCRQDEYDWNFVHQLLGIGRSLRFLAAGRGREIAHAGDHRQSVDVQSLSAQTVRFYRAGTNSETDALTQWSGTRTLQSALLTTRTIGSIETTSITNINEKGNRGPASSTRGRASDSKSSSRFVARRALPLILKPFCTKGSPATDATHVTSAEVRCQDGAAVQMSLR